MSKISNVFGIVLNISENQRETLIEIQLARIATQSTTIPNFGSTTPKNTIISCSLNLALIQPRAGPVRKRYLSATVQSLTLHVLQQLFVLCQFSIFGSSHVGSTLAGRNDTSSGMIRRRFLSGDGTANSTASTTGAEANIGDRWLSKAEHKCGRTRSTATFTEDKDGRLGGHSR